MTLIQHIRESIDEDDLDQSSLLASVYHNANPDEKGTLDEAFMALCGWQLSTLIEKSDDGE
jgi:hypothetical protein